MAKKTQVKKDIYRIECDMRHVASEAKLARAAAILAEERLARWEVWGPARILELKKEENELEN